ncbi:MAG: POTRA domain-containing protein, partial [bacterium]
LLRIKDTGRTNMDFSNIDSLIAIGRAEMAAKLPQLNEMIKKLHERAHNKIAHKTFYVTKFTTPVPSLHPQTSIASKSNGHGQIIRAEQIISYLDQLVEEGIYHGISAVIRKAEFGFECQINAQLNPALKKVIFAGNTVFASDSLRSFFKHLENQPINRHETKSAFEKIISLYRKSGYALAGISKIEYEKTSGIGTVFIDEGRIDSIKIAGLHRTKKYVVTREFPQNQGDIFNFRDAQKGIDNIFGTGLFDRVSYALNRTGNATNLLLKLKEKKYTALGLSGRIDSERKSRVFLELSDENLLGMGQNSLCKAFMVHKTGIFAANFRSNVFSKHT